MHRQKGCITSIQQFMHPTNNKSNINKTLSPGRFFVVPGNGTTLLGIPDCKRLQQSKQGKSKINKKSTKINPPCYGKITRKLITLLQG